ncbi:MAG: prepilin-type N-terminal cleavage/methylation domain-containing protein [Pirellulales bacterium]|nr:prepilin-type N-terminal cleavage/methylation domain-containing protein [Pirellulales bacterium]
MNWPGVICFRKRRFSKSGRGGFTLIEVLVAVTLTLVMMAAVVQIFAIVGKSINNSRSTLEMSERIRAAASRLRLDLEGVTADMIPPGRPEEGKGYFEYIEGPIGPVPAATPGYNNDESGAVDSTVGDHDDILQFTTRSRNEPFVGRGVMINAAGGIQRVTISSQVAEVAWFMRGTTLYRRVLLVSPSFDADISNAVPREAEIPIKNRYADPSMHGPDIRHKMGFYNNYDLSVHWDANLGKIVCNTLADLTRRECRFAHPPLKYQGGAWIDAFPYALYNQNQAWRNLGLPILRETAHAAWPFPVDGKMPYQTNNLPAVVLTSTGTLFDAWANPLPVEELDPETGAISALKTLPADPPQQPGAPSYPPVNPSAPQKPSPRYNDPMTRASEDVILTNVLGFDVKVWDPGAPVLLTPSNVSLLPGDLNYPAALALYAGGGVGAPLLASRGAYADLGYGYNYLTTPPTLLVTSNFSAVDWYAQQRATPPVIENVNTARRVYDTWSIHYEHDGKDQDDGGPGPVDEGTNGFDDDGNGVVDDPGELEAPPPYPYPLRGIQIKIRVYDPDSQQVREVTIKHDFLQR